MKSVKNIFIVLLLSLIAMLGACSEEEGLITEDLSDYPSSVQDGTVSKEYYEQVVSFAKFDNVYFELRKKMLGDIVSDPSLLNKSDIMATFDSGLSDYDEFLNDLELNPTTDADKEMNEIVLDIKLKQLTANKLISSFLKSKDMQLFLGASKEINLTTEQTEKLNSLMKEYLTEN